MTQKHQPGQHQERLDVKLSAAQRQTILRYADLPTALGQRFSDQAVEEAVTPLTLDELDDLLDCLHMALYRAKGNEKQKVERIVQKVAGVLGSEINPADINLRRPAKKSTEIFQIRIILRGIDPPVWRRVQARDCALHTLHAIIQMAMGWDFAHLYAFQVAGTVFADLDMLNDGNVEDACPVRLTDVLPARNRRPRFVYRYDFGDEWVHQLIVEERLPAEPGVKYPRCLAGARACPPEDCGGLWGYHSLVEALKNPQRNQERLDWLDERFDPEKFDLAAVNKTLVKDPS